MTTPKAGNNPLFHAMVEAGVQAGYPRTDDLNGYQQEGFGPMDRTVTPEGRRAATGRGYLDQARGRPNLTIVTHAPERPHPVQRQARHRRLLPGGQRRQPGHRPRPPRSIGVQRRDRLAAIAATLRRRPGGPLRDLDIPVVHDLPGVGANLQDHLELYLQYACKQPVSIYPATKWWNQPAIGAQWLFLGKGLGASNQFEAGGFIRTREAFRWPNIQFHFLRWRSTTTAQGRAGARLPGAHGLDALAEPRAHPPEVQDPRQHPSILFNYMSHEQDWQEFRDGIRLTREIMNQPALDPIGAAS